ncbi:MAG: hypothetical protein AAFO04_29890 [Cyanobacteria bacterium J06592_8]
MTSLHDKNGQSQTAEELLNQAHAATQKREPVQPKRPSKPQEKALSKASEQTHQKGSEVIQKFNDTQKQIEALEIKKGLEKGKHSARRMAEAEQIGFVGELTKCRVQNAKSRFQGLDAIEQKIDAELGESEQFKNILEGESETDPLEQINELLANMPSSNTNQDLFSLLGSDSISE